MGGWRCGYLRRPREGSDYTTINLYFVSHVFQSTLPRRERHLQQVVNNLLNSNFNPRSREGSDAGRRGQLRVHRHFNPRSREGSDSKNHQDYSQ